MKFLNVPHYSQLDNEFHPTDTCNLTSAAMCLAYHGIKPKQRVQLEDELYEYATDNKLSRHVPEDIASIIKAHGCQDRFTENFGFKAPSFARRLFLLIYVNIKTVNIKKK